MIVIFFSVISNVIVKYCKCTAVNNVSVVSNVCVATN